MEEQKIGMVEVVEEETGKVALVPFFESEQGEGKLWCSLASKGKNDREYARGVSQALGNPDLPFRTVLGKVLEVENVLVHQIVIEKEDGSLAQASRCVFLLKGGKTAAGVSEGVLRKLLLFFQLVGTPPWTPPLKLSIAEIQTRKGRRSYDLVMEE